MSELIENLIMKYLKHKYKYWSLKVLETPGNCRAFEEERIRWRNLMMAFIKFKEK